MHLPGWLRFLGLVVLLPLGALPSVAFFAWIERGATLPILPLELGWPVIRLYHWPTPALVAWNFLLVLAFGALHSALAQPSAHRLIERVAPRQLTRLIYFAVTGASAWLVMAFWQNTGVMLWTLPLDTAALDALSLAVYWSLIAAAAVFIARHGASRFIGLEQLYRNTDRATRTQLIRTGVYARVRHPVYTFTLLAVALAPRMPLDRTVIFAAFVAYLAVGVPIEERKLVKTFGKDYERYRREVPAILPRIRS